jgi:rubredoxin
MSDTGPVDVPQSKCQQPCCVNGGRDFTPMPLVFVCPECKLQHIDQLDPVTGIDWATRKHKRHKCVDYLRVIRIIGTNPVTGEPKTFEQTIVHKGCGFEWQPALVFTVGVEAIL